MAGKETNEGRDDLFEKSRWSVREGNVAGGIPDVEKKENLQRGRENVEGKKSAEDGIQVKQKRERRGNLRLVAYVGRELSETGGAWKKDRGKEPWRRVTKNLEGKRERSSAQKGQKSTTDGGQKVPRSPKVKERVLRSGRQSALGK